MAIISMAARSGASWRQRHQRKTLLASVKRRIINENGGMLLF